MANDNDDRQREDSLIRSASAPTPQGGAWARRGWMATTVLLATALVLNALISFRGARLAVPGIDRGQADFFGSGLWELLTDGSIVSDSAAVSRFLQNNERRGLRYIALVDDGGRSVVQSGRPIGDGQPPLADESGRIPLVAIGRRLRAYFPGPSLSAAAMQHPSYIVVEFEPTAATRLTQTARRSLVLAVAAAALLSFAAWIFLRLSARYENARLRLEQQRHLTLLGEMSAVLAHEIRNPLASLKGHAQLAAERLPDDTREKRCIDHVIEDADRLDSLTSDLLSFARSSPIELEPVSPAELMRVAAADVFAAGESPTVTLDVDAAPPTWPLDAGRVRQALVNLLDNARKASLGQRAPVARVALESNRLVFEVRDFGHGLPNGREERIFDPFFTTRTTGTGLGLAVASRVAEMHHGEISAANHPDVGAVFRLSIPRPTT